MSLDKSQIQQLQSCLTPAQKRYNILEVIQKFPNNPHMHETFRQICLHYESSALSFTQIMQYLFGQFNRNSLELDAGRNGNKWGPLRIRKSNAKEDFKVVLLGPQANTERIRELVMIDSRDARAELYAITNTTMRQFSLDTNCFKKQLIRVDNELVSKVAVSGSLVSYITKHNVMYLQVLPHKLQEINRKKNAPKNKDQINRIQVHRFKEEQSVIFLGALNQEEWIVVLRDRIVLVSITFTSGENFHPQIKPLKIGRKNEETTITSACLLSYPFIGLLTEQKSLIIVNTGSMKVTNTMCNDANFTTFCYNEAKMTLVAGDFGGYVMALTFNRDFGDIEEQGIGVRKKTLESPQPQQNQFFSTRYLKRESPSKSPTKHQDNSSIFNKEVKTAFTLIVQNTFRNPIELMATKQETLFTYEAKYHKSIKLWNIATLQVYQKVQLNMEIYEMKVCGVGLYLVSREKGYLCYYPFEVQDNLSSKKTTTQVLELAINSNIMFISTTNMSDNVVYKLRLSNKPSLTQYVRKPTKNAEKLLKYAYYKNQVLLFNLTKTHTPILQLYGIFGQSKQQIRDLNGYHSMVRYPQKEGLILWSDSKVYIRCKAEHQPTRIRKHASKGQNIYENQPHNKDKQRWYTQVIVMNEHISKVKVFQNYVTIICINNVAESKQDSSDPNKQFMNKSNSYLLDENTMCLGLIFEEIDQNYRIIQSYKHYTLFVKNLRIENMKEYYVFDHRSRQAIWKAQPIQGWTLETVNMINIDLRHLQLVCIYKSATPISVAENKTKPMFYLIKTTINIQTEQKNYINLANSMAHAHSQSQTIDEIKARSIYHRIKSHEIVKAEMRQKQGHVKTSFKIFLSSGVKWSDDAKQVEGKVLHYQKQEGVLMFGIICGGLAALYELDDDPVAEVIGILNFDKINHNAEGVENSIKDYIVNWNKNYKKDDEQLWQQAKNSAINRVKNRNASPLSLHRSDSLRSTSKKWNPENIEEPFVLPNLQKRSKSYNKIPSSNPQRVNQIIHKHNIYENLMKEKMEMEKEKEKQIKNKIVPPPEEQLKRALTLPLRTNTSLSQNPLSVYETPIKMAKSSEERSFAEKKHTESTMNRQMGYSLSKGMSKKRYKTEEQEIIVPFRVEEEELASRKGSKTRQSYFKTPSTVNKNDMVITQSVKKQLTFDDLIRQTKTTFDNKKSTEQISKKPLLSPKKRYQTQPEEQLQKSRIIEQSLLPHLPGARRQAQRRMIYQKSLVFNMLSKQKYIMKKTMLNHNLERPEGMETEVMEEVKQALAKMVRKQ